MTTKFFRKFFKTAFIGIIIDDDVCDVALKIYKGDKIISSDSKKYQLQSGIFPTTLLTFIEQVYTKNQFVYSATILTTINQGGISDCSKDAFAKFQIESRNVQTICMDEKWAVYTSKIDIDNIEKKYEKLGGLDYIFSPLILLERLFFEEIAKSGVLMVVLRLRSVVCIAVYSGTKLLYSSFMSIKIPEKIKPTSADTTESTFEDFFEEGEVHEMSDDNMVDLDDLSVELEEESMQPLSDSIEDQAMRGASAVSLPVSLEDAGNNLRLADFVKESFNEFYKNPVFESAFIEKISIADPYGDNGDLKLILESELLLSVEIKQFDLADLLCDFAFDEASQ